jgi:DNA-binding transcriptional MerR regulator
MPEHPENPSALGYTAVQAARITGLSKRRVIYLAEQRLVVPSLMRPGGRRRHYSFGELIELRAIAKLTATDERVSVARVRAVVEALREIADRPLITCTLAVADGKVLWADEQTRTLVDVVRGFQTVLLVNLAYIETDIRRAVALEQLDPPPGHRTQEPIAA